MTYLPRFFIVLLLTAYSTEAEECRNRKADVVFMLDVSGSVTVENFSQLISFVINLLNGLDIGPDQIRVGVFTFTDIRETYVHLNDFKSKEQLKDLLQQRTESYRPGGPTPIDTGLRYMLNVSFAPENGGRPSVTKLGVVVTDGEGTNPLNTTIAEAQLVKDSGVVLHTVGIGSSIREAELEAIASKKQYVFTVASFQSLEQIRNLIQIKICETIKVCIEKRDFAFLIDLSESSHPNDSTALTDFVRRLARTLDLGAYRVRMGVMTLTDAAEVVLTLKDSYDMEEVLYNLTIAGFANYSGRNGGDLGKALKSLEDTMFSEAQGGRRDVPNIAVVIKAGRSAASRGDLDGIRGDAQRVRVGGVTLFCVGVGQDTGPVLQAVASDPGAVLLVNSSSDLDQHAVDLVELNLCRVEETCVLEVVTIVGLILAIFFLTLTVLAFVISRKFRQDQTQATLFCGAVAVLASWVIYLAGFPRVQYGAQCLVVAALLHYVILASFLWLLMEGILQYRLSVSSARNYVIKASALSWGLPVIPVIVVLIVDKDLYKDGQKCCWMSLAAFPLIYTLFIPAGIIVIANIVFDVLTVLQLCCGKKGHDRNSAGLSSLLCLLLPLGASWVFFYASYTRGSKQTEGRVLLHAFPLVAALHGLLTFVVFVLRNPATRPCAAAGKTAVHPAGAPLTSPITLSSAVPDGEVYAPPKK